jgi:hypothetical protein
MPCDSLQIQRLLQHSANFEKYDSCKGSVCRRKSITEKLILGRLRIVNVSVPY